MLITLPNAYGDAITNMAIDAALMHTLAAETAVFRHYAWTEPAITFGYSQKLATVRTQFPEKLQFCRRLTGGGIVDHRNDWTYSLLLPRKSNVGQKLPVIIYKELHSCILKALASLGVTSQLAPCPRACKASEQEISATSNQCFIQASADDVLRPDGKKIAGAALKRTQDTLLLQGSIDRASLPPTFDFATFQINFIKEICIQWETSETQLDDLRVLFDGERIQLEKTRFASPEWLGKY
jgi:lipoate-protein ligase A